MPRHRKNRFSIFSYPYFSLAEENPNTCHLELGTAYSVEKAHDAQSVRAKRLRHPAGDYSPKPLGRANVEIRTGVEAKRADVKTPVDRLLENGSKRRLGVLGSRHHPLVE